MAAKAKKGSTGKTTREEILESAIADIKSKFGDGAIMRLGDTAQNKVEVIPSGVLPLNIALGIATNRN